MIGTAIFGAPAAQSLSAGGFQDPTSQSAQAAALLAAKFHQGDMELVFLLRSSQGVRDGAARAVGTDIVRQLDQTPDVARVSSPWTTPQAAPGLLSADGKSAIIIAGINGAEDLGPKHAQALADRLAHGRDGVDVQAGGMAMVFSQVTQQA
ncbi:MAG TPA: MMPL family transporter, partial [Mycobacterium sp.]|nr:MMPL family transporter [Mycobacterium sp.]